MKIELSDAEAERVASALRCLHGGEEINRLAAMFEVAGKGRTTASEQEHHFTHGIFHADAKDAYDMHSHFTSEEEAEQARAAIHWADRYVVRPLPVPYTETLLTCDNCGNTTFGYEESLSNYRSPGGQDAEAKTVTVLWSSNGDSDGDSDPGLFCDNYEGGGCGLAVDLPDDWDIGWD